MQRKLSVADFSLGRLVRTATSEAFVIFKQDNAKERPIRVGFLDLHINGKVYYGTLVLEIKLKTKELEHLLTQLDDQLIESSEMREDFILTVFQGKEIGYYSDNITEERRQYEPPTRNDLANITAILNKVLGRHQDARGKLNEHALVAYFQSLGYEAKIADSRLDQLKIDVVATNEAEIIYAQSKLGSVTKREMRSIVQSVAEQPTVGTKQKIAAIAASAFPIDCDLVRRQLEAEFDTPLLCIQKYQIIQAAPEYRRMLAE